MHTKKGFQLRKVCGEPIIVAEGKENIDFNNIISMNESSAYLWEKVTGKEFSTDDLVRLLTERYEVNRDTASEDAKKVARQWVEAGIAEE